MEAPGECPRGHRLGPGQASLCHGGTVVCRVCYEQDPRAGEFAPAEPEWMLRFRTLVNAGRRVEAMAVMDAALPVPAGPVRGR